jgi:NADPH-dependent glutamate synthase beta subunit-like oxidoreductase
VDRYRLESSRPRFFAGGDLVTGASNVSNAMAFGKRAARSIDEQLMDSDAGRWASLFPKVQYEQSPPKDVSESGRHTPHELTVRERMQSWDEVVVGLSAEDAHEEACRCLRCDIKVTASR